MSHQNQPTTPAFVSLPVNKPFRLIIDVNPVHGECVMPSMCGKYDRVVRTGLERIELAVSVEEMEGADHE